MIGKLFWLGAAAALSSVERWAAEEHLHALERKEFIRRERRSSVAGETEYAFRHLLVRDVAYGQIPRAARAETHRRAAVWIESLGRPDDQEAKDPQTLVPALGVAARVFFAAGRIEEARALGRELLATPRLAGEFRIVEFALVADRLGFDSEVKKVIEQVRPQNPWTCAGIALVDCDYAVAADTFYEIGDLELEAEARLRAGEKLVAEGRRADADEQLAKALAFFRSVGATRYMREAEALLSAPVEGRTSIGQ